jgi:hypothetical protein
VDSEPETIFELHEEKLAMPGGGAKLASGQAFYQVLCGDLLQYSGVLHLDFFYGLMEGWVVASTYRRRISTSGSSGIIL